MYTTTYAMSASTYCTDDSLNLMHHKHNSVLPIAGTECYHSLKYHETQFFINYSLGWMFSYLTVLLNTDLYYSHPAPALGVITA
jgi:hypothetical protein